MNIQHFFQKKAPLMVGIDIGSHSVKAVLLSLCHGVYKVEAYAIVPVHQGAIADREIQDIVAAGKIICLLRQRLPRHAKYAAIAVSGASVISKVILMDACLTDDELENQIEIEADSLIPYPLSDICLDFEKLPLNCADPLKTQVLLSAGRAQSIEDRVAALEQAGFIAKVVDIESYALSRAMALCWQQLPDDASSKRIALLDVGAAMLLFSVIDQGQIIYTRDQQFSSELHDYPLSGMPDGFTDSHAPAGLYRNMATDSAAEIQQAFLAALLQQARRILQMYQSLSGMEPVDYLLVSGGGILTAGLDKLLADELGIETVIANPFTTMQLADNVNRQQLQQYAPQLMVACGLALRSFSPCHI